ncbi:MAG: hypothetical protein ABSH08_03580 [Tepidisphaeraceae bacterium]
MIDTRTGIAQGTHTTNPTVAPTVRPVAPSSGISLRPQSAGIAPPPVAPTRPPHAEEPLTLVTEEKPGTPEAAKSKIHNISAASSLAQHTYRRPTNTDKTGAVRMRTFHCRLSEQGVEYLDQTINDWLESHPDIEVKFTASTIGMWDGKLKEPTLIINVWY